MRGTVAKRIRRLAESSTIGLPGVAYEADYKTTKNYAGFDGNLAASRQCHTIILAKECTRKLYQELKKGKRAIK
ncbi:hypothetical protein N9917_02325 [Deltaproteobacteria bacterium]|nr:hypothetical protein [Deltaproteobacteria bacterium]